MIFFSYLSSNRVVTSYSFGSFVQWLQKHRLAKGKLIVVEKFAESVSPKEFIDAIQKTTSRKMACGAIPLIYIGRLHREKLVDGLIKMMSVLKTASTDLFRLILIGDGPERESLEFMAKELKVFEQIDFVGYLKSEQLVPYLLFPTGIFVSPLTGQSLREAALCGLPIVAYNMDWISGLFEHDKTALLVPPHDYEAMARQVLRLVKDNELRKRLSKNGKELAWRLWSPQGVRESLQKAFKDD
jgi:glycosyltransferase involved in cell wall biosynthesis